MERSEQNRQGALKISEDVIATVSKLATQDVEGVDSVIAPSRSFKEMVLKPKVNTPIEVVLLNDVAQITVSIVVKQGFKVLTVSEAVQKNVKEAVQSMTGIAVSKVNVVVSSVVFSDKENTPVQ